MSRDTQVAGVFMRRGGVTNNTALTVVVCATPITRHGLPPVMSTRCEDAMYDVSGIQLGTAASLVRARKRARLTVVVNGFVEDARPVSSLALCEPLHPEPRAPAI